jgi:hypothetical protein
MRINLPQISPQAPKPVRLCPHLVGFTAFRFAGLKFSRSTRAESSPSRDDWPTRALAAASSYLISPKTGALAPMSLCLQSIPYKKEKPLTGDKKNYNILLFWTFALLIFA